MRYELIYLLAGGTTAIVALVAVWAARSRVYWFWRAAALLTCFVLLVPVGAAELNLLFMPLAGILFLASAGQQWWERRKHRASANPALECPDQAANSKGRFSLKELFLVTLLAAVAAWIVARIVQDGVVMEWRKLPLAVATLAAVAWIAVWWVESPRRWRAGYAVPVAYVAGFAVAVYLVYALTNVFDWHSTWHIAIGTGFLSVGAIGIAYLWLVYVGRILPTIVLMATIAVASLVHLHLVGDWLHADYLLLEHRPRLWSEWGSYYGFSYFHVALVVGVGALLIRGAARPVLGSWRHRVVSVLSVVALVPILAPLIWLYWQMLETPAITIQTAATSNSLEEANAILLKLHGARKKLPPGPPSPNDALTLHESAAAKELTPKLFAVLEESGYVSRKWGTKAEEEAIPDQLVESIRMRSLATEFLGPAGYAPRDSAEECSHFCLAWIRYSNYSQRGALASESFDGYASEAGGHLWLAQHDHALSSPRRRDVLNALRDIDRTREPLSVLLAREAAWSERHERWRGRLRRVVLSLETRAVNPLLPYPTVREMHDNCVALARLNMTNMAIQLFQKEKRRLPSNLRELAPDYLDETPIDPYSNRALVYHSTDDGFLLYSVGSDGQDDGGNTVGFSWIDWVNWPSLYDGDLDLQLIVREVNALQAKANSPAPTSAQPPGQAKGKSTTPSSP